MIRLVFLTLVVALAAPVTAVAFERVSDRDVFLRLIDEKDLKRFGIRLTVAKDGRIMGRAFGRQVSGQWEWSDGLFCRDLYFGSEDLGPNCQTVEVRGKTMRFTADEGQGMSANLTLD